MISLPSSVRTNGDTAVRRAGVDKLPGRTAGYGVRLFVLEQLDEQEETGMRSALRELENAGQR